MISNSVRRHIRQLSTNELFTTSEFLNYGSRNAIDQSLSRLVREGTIIRVSPGVFARNRFKEYTKREIRAAKTKFHTQLTRAPGK
jgi:hypothetical protein